MRFASSTLLAIVLFSTMGVAQGPRIEFLSYADARGVIDASGDAVPSGIALIDARSWGSWIHEADSDIRKRLERGDEDSIVNLLLFGTSFTREPRITEKQINGLGTGDSARAGEAFRSLLGQRIRDLVTAFDLRRADSERVAFARELIFRKLAPDLKTPAGKQVVADYLVGIVRRFYSESEGFNNLIEQARRNQEDVFVVRSQMFARRGLSSDTQLKPNLALENALRELKQKKLLNRVLRVAIVGPGLDFTDKDEGYDFYPPQTLQPFALIESLLRLGLTDPGKLQVDTYDLSPKVNSHIRGLASRARRGEAYRVMLPLDRSRQFSHEFLKYWQSFGSLIGSPGKVVDPGLNDVDVRSVNIRTGFLTKVHAYDANIVLQAPILADASRYDLIIGTNIFLYYSPFEQGLAMRNIDKMLRRGGILLSNNALVEFPFTPIHNIGYTATVYSAHKNDADAIVWYRKDPG